MIYHGPVSGNWKRVDGAASAETIGDSVFRFEVVLSAKRPVQLSWSISSTAQQKKPMGNPVISIALLLALLVCNNAVNSVSVNNCTAVLI
jgi:hypothetical protein